MTTDLIDQPARTERPAQPQTGALSIAQYIAQSGATIEQALAMLELQVRADNHKLDLMREQRSMDEEDRKAAALLAFRRDFAAFRGENVIVPKNKHVNRGKAGSFMQAEFHMVGQMLSPALSKHGFGFRHDQRFGTKDWPADGTNPAIPAGTMIAVSWVYVTCFLEHKDGHAERLDLDGPPDDGQANGLIQNMQSSASMLKRLSLLALTGTATGGEDDENGLRKRGGQSIDDPDQERLLDAFRGAALQGTKALRDYYTAHTPSDTFWKEHSKALKGAAQAADGAPQ